MSMAGIDVVVLSLDRLADTHECIDSVLQQDHPDVRLWVLDQGSHIEGINSLCDRATVDGFHFSVGKRIGVAAGRNKGYRKGGAPLIVALDNDAVLSDPEVLTRIEQRFAEDTKLGCLALAVYDYANGGPDLSSWSYPWPVESHFETEFLTARFCGAGHAISRKAFEDTQGYDEELFFFGEELDLSWSLIAAGYEIRYVPEVSVRHKSSQEQRIDWANGRYYHNVRNMLYLTRKYFRNPYLQATYTGGYLMKGLRNGLFKQAVKGVRDSLRMSDDWQRWQMLEGEAREYVLRHEYAPRGTFWQRMRREVLPPLPSSRTPVR
jgi:GT2 family glycosyltransferase